MVRLFTDGYISSKALEENKTINSSKEALSDDITEQNKAFAKKQGIQQVSWMSSFMLSAITEIIIIMCRDHISDDEVGTIYERRISTLKNMLDSGGETFTQAEKDFLIQKYEN